LKYLLNFGQVSHYLGYNALEDFFPRQEIKPNPQCDDRFCRQRQREYRERKANEPVPEETKPEQVATVHEENEWNIECVADEALDEPTAAVSSTSHATVQGLKFAYDAPDPKEDTKEEDNKQPQKPIDLSQLRAQLKGL